jgi:hypothetical protein
MTVFELIREQEAALTATALEAQNGEPAVVITDQQAATLAAGAQAFLDGDVVHSDPYLRGSAGRGLWRSGWMGGGSAVTNSTFSR